MKFKVQGPPRLECDCCDPPLKFFDRTALCRHRKKKGVVVLKGRPPIPRPPQAPRIAVASSDSDLLPSPPCYKTPKSARYR